MIILKGHGGSPSCGLSLTPGLIGNLNIHKLLSITSVILFANVAIPMEIFQG